MHPSLPASGDRPAPAVLPVMLGPNITGQLAPYDSTAEAYTGAFSFVGTSNGVTSNWREISRGGIDASRSSSLYGASATVQPPALELLPCIKF